MLWSRIFTTKELNSSNKTTVDSKPLEMKSKPIEPPPTNDSPSSQESVCDSDVYKIISSESTCSSDSGKRKLSTVEKTEYDSDASNLHESNAASEDKQDFKKFKTDRFDSFLNCEICHDVFDCPVTLPCGDTICYDHIIRYNKEKNSIMNTPFKNKPHAIACGLCLEKFAIGEVETSKIIQEQIDMKLNKIQFGPSFEEARLSIENLNKELDRIGSQKKTYFNELYDSYEKLRKKTIDEREHKKKLIDQQYDTILNDINLQETKSCKIITKNYNIVQSVSSRVNEYRNRLNSLTVDETKWNDITMASKFYNSKLLALESELKTFNTANDTNNNNLIQSNQNLELGLNELQVTKNVSGITWDEGFHLFKFENFKNFAEKINDTVSTEPFIINDTKWYIEFGNNGTLKEDGSNSYDIYLCYICADLTKIVEVDFLFEFIDRDDPTNNKMLKIPLLPFSYSNDSWSFSVKKDIVDQYYDDESDSVSFSFYLKPKLTSIEKESRFNFE